jgi:TRAP-type C4-dicarboxylate transport system substrate-binding protein
MWLEKRIEQLTEGKVDVICYHATVGDEKAMTEDIKIGTLDMLPVGNAVFSGFVKEAGLFNVPSVFKGNTQNGAYANAFKALDGQIGDWIAEKALEKGFRIEGWWRMGSFEIFSNVPIRKIGDLKGLKIRTLPSPEQVKVFKAWGALPVSMAFSEVYSALQAKVIDAVVTVANAAYSRHIHEIIKYQTKTNQLLAVCPFLVSEKNWGNYPEYLKRAIHQAAHEVKLLQRQRDIEHTGEIDEIFIKHGIKIIELPPEEIKRFREIAEKEVWPGVVTSQEEKEWFQKLQKVQE